MATSSILGGERVPTAPSGTDMASLGPSDLSDSGSDTLGAHSLDELEGDSDSAGTGERPSIDEDLSVSGADILPDHLEQLAAEPDVQAMDFEMAEAVEETTSDGSLDEQADDGPGGKSAQGSAEPETEDRPELIDTPADVRALAVDEPEPGRGGDDDDER